MTDPNDLLRWTMRETNNPGKQSDISRPGSASRDEFRLTLLSQL
jgi:hypothetical protein